MDSRRARYWILNGISATLCEWRSTEKLSVMVSLSKSTANWQSESVSGELDAFAGADQGSIRGNRIGCERVRQLVSTRLDSGRNLDPRLCCPALCASQALRYRTVAFR